MASPNFNHIDQVPSLVIQVKGGREDTLHVILTPQRIPVFPVDISSIAISSISWGDFHPLDARCTAHSRTSIVIMAEAIAGLAVASSIIALIDITGKVVKTGWGCFRALKSPPKELAKLCPS
ncbi:hypothetical protein B0J14DRAFT_562492 [Halenospora varia]|nr:hypothetical protein B0J14DRAFT_562492 [Halenospora varia]